MQDCFCKVYSLDLWNSKITDFELKMSEIVEQGKAVAIKFELVEGLQNSDEDNDGKYDENSKNQFEEQQVQESNEILERNTTLYIEGEQLSTTHRPENDTDKQMRQTDDVLRDQEKETPEKTLTLSYTDSDIEKNQIVKYQGKKAIAVKLERTIDLIEEQHSDQQPQEEVVRQERDCSSDSEDQEGTMSKEKLKRNIDCKQTETEGQQNDQQKQCRGENDGNSKRNKDTLVESEQAEETRGEHSPSNSEGEKRQVQDHQGKKLIVRLHRIRDQVERNDDDKGSRKSKRHREQIFYGDKENESQGEDDYVPDSDQGKEIEVENVIDSDDSDYLESKRAEKKPIRENRSRGTKQTRKSGRNRKQIFYGDQKEEGQTADTISDSDSEGEKKVGCRTKRSKSGRSVAKKDNNVEGTRKSRTCKPREDMGKETHCAFKQTRNFSRKRKSYISPDSDSESEVEIEHTGRKSKRKLKRSINGKRAITIKQQQSTKDNSVKGSRTSLRIHKPKDIEKETQGEIKYTRKSSRKRKPTYYGDQEKESHKKAALLPDSDSEGEVKEISKKIRIQKREMKEKQIKVKQARKSKTKGEQIVGVKSHKGSSSDSVSEGEVCQIEHQHKKFEVKLDRKQKTKAKGHQHEPQKQQKDRVNMGQIYFGGQVIGQIFRGVGDLEAAREEDISLDSLSEGEVQVVSVEHHSKGEIPTISVDSHSEAEEVHTFSAADPDSHSEAEEVHTFSAAECDSDGTEVYNISPPVSQSEDEGDERIPKKKEEEKHNKVIEGDDKQIKDHRGKKSKENLIRNTAGEQVSESKQQQDDGHRQMEQGGDNIKPTRKSNRNRKQTFYGNQENENQEEDSYNPDSDQQKESQEEDSSTECEEAKTVVKKKRTKKQKSEVTEKEPVLYVKAVEIKPRLYGKRWHRKRYIYGKVQCDLCGKEVNRHYFKGHMEQHNQTGKKICEICGKIFAFTRRLKYHIKIMHRKRDFYPCSVCGKQYASLRYMQWHEMVSHKKVLPNQEFTGSKPWCQKRKLPCSYPGCKLVYQRIRDRLAHEARVHGGENLKNSLDDVTCDICNKCFSSNANMIRHKITHRENPRPYKCSYCTAYFTQSSSRKAHERKHTGELPYACKYCPKKFTQSSNKNTHEKRCKAASERDALLKPGRPGTKRSHKKPDKLPTKSDRVAEQVALMNWTNNIHPTEHFDIPVITPLPRPTPGVVVEPISFKINIPSEALIPESHRVLNQVVHDQVQSEFATKKAEYTHL